MSGVLGALGAVSGAASAVGTLVGGGAVDVYPPDLIRGWRAQLQPASWLGRPFLVRTENVRGGRRVAVHEYPDKDNVWPEDLGRLPRAFALEGYIVGDDCAAQRQALQDAAEAEGPGELIHPTFGSVTVSLVGFSSAARADLGRCYELRFEFIQGGAQQYPSAADDTGAGVGDAMAQAVAACDGDFVTAAGGGDFLGSISAAVADARAGVGNAAAALGIPGAIQAVQGFTAQAQSLVGDAASAFNAVRGLLPPGSSPGAGSGGVTYGRYDAGARITPLVGITSVPAAIAAANQARAAVAAACTGAVQAFQGGQSSSAGAAASPAQPPSGTSGASPPAGGTGGTSGGGTSASSPSGGTSAAFSYQQAMPAAVWVITHPDFGRPPDLVVVNAATGATIYPDVSYPTGTELVLSFGQALVAGTAYLT